MGLYQRCGKDHAKRSCDCAWWGQYMYRGTNVRENLARWSGEKVKGKQDAETIFDRLKVAVRNGTYRKSKYGVQITRTGTEQPQPISGTFAEAMGRYLTEHIETLRGNGQDDEAAKTIERFGPMKLDDITHEDLSAYITELQKPCLLNPTHKTKKVRSRRTINRYRSMLRCMWHWAIRKKLATKHPMIDPETGKQYDDMQHDAKAEKKRRSRTMLPGEEAALMKLLADESNVRRIAANQRLKLAVDFATDTGLRFSEQRRATWADVDTKPGYIRVIGTDPEDGEDVSKNGLERYVYLFPKAQRVIARLREDLPTDSSRWSPNKLLFSELDGTAYADWRQTYWKRLTEAGIKGLSWHDLRRTYATRLMQDDVHLAFISEQLGHQDVLVTMRYLGITVEGLERAMKDVAERRERERLASTNSAQDTGTTGNALPFTNGGN